MALWLLVEILLVVLILAGVFEGLVLLVLLSDPRHQQPQRLFIHIRVDLPKNHQLLSNIKSADQQTGRRLTLISIVLERGSTVCTWWLNIHL